MNSAPLLLATPKRGKGSWAGKLGDILFDPAVSLVQKSPQFHPAAEYTSVALRVQQNCP
jgi:hypothetical protein